MENLRLNILKEQERIDQELNARDKKQEFYQEFFTKYGLPTVDLLLNAQSTDLAIALLASSDSSDDIDTIKKTVHGNKIIFECLDKEGLEAVLSLLETLKEAELYDELYDILKHERMFILKNPCGKEAKVINKIREMLRVMNISQPAFADFMALAKNHDAKLMETCRILASVKKLKHDLIDYETELSETEKEFGVRLRNKDRVKAINEQMHEEWDVASLTQSIREARQYYEKKEQAAKSKTKSLNKEKSAYSKLEQQLQIALSSQEIKNPEALISKIPSEDIRKQVLRIIYSHNQKHYNALASEYETLSANDKYHYQALLTKYGITPESYDVETIMGNSLTDVEQMLIQLTKLNITSPENVLNVLQQSDLATLTTYSALTEKGIVTTELLFTHQNLLDKDSREYRDFMRNIALLQDKKINPYYLSASQDTFTINHALFRENIETMEEYGLVDSMFTGMNSSFLNQRDLPSSIDTLLELGFERNLEEYPELLNYSSRFTRLKVAKTLNIPLSSTEELLDILTTDKFFLADEDIPNYLYNAVSFNIPRVDQALSNQELAKDLEVFNKYPTTKRTYDINGVIISRNKVKRNLSEISETTNKESRLLNATISGSFLTDEELSQVIAVIAPTRKPGQVKQKI